MKRIKQIFLTAVSLFLIPIAADAQCKTFVKKQCLPKLSPFIHNGQMNSTVLLSGDNAELAMTFYSGQNYRILVCAQEVLGKVQFKLKDANNNVVFNSKDQGDVTSWDFNVATTQQLIVEVIVPPSDATNDIVPNGCVSIVVGFKQ